MKKFITTFALVLTISIMFCACSQKNQTTQTATAWLDSEGTESSVTIDISEGWSVDFAKGAVYLNDSKNNDFAIVMTLDKDVYDERFENHKDAESIENGVKYEEDGRAYILFKASNGVGFLIDADTMPNAEKILKKLLIE